MACTEYSNDPSPMVANTVRLTPRARLPRASPTPAGTPQARPPLAVAKNDAGRVVGSQRSCSAIVDVDSVTGGESAGLTVLRVDHTASVVSGGDAESTISPLGGCFAGAGRAL